MKARFLAMGAIITLLGAALIASRGAALGYEGLALLGVVLLVVGLLWR